MSTSAGAARVMKRAVQSVCGTGTLTVRQHASRAIALVVAAFARRSRPAQGAGSELSTYCGCALARRALRLALASHRVAGCQIALRRALAVTPLASTDFLSQ